jgi:hypothetical protein
MNAKGTLVGINTQSAAEKAFLSGPVLPDGLDQDLFQLYFPLKQAYRVFFLSTNM